MQPTLFPVVTVHCFFGCAHVVTAADPNEAHDRMEDHYDGAHRADLDALG